MNLLSLNRLALGAVSCYYENVNVRSFFMAIVIYGTPVNFMNTKQLRIIARGSGIYYDLSTSRASLISSINA